MKLHYYRHEGQETNFGDDLNPWLWSQILGDLLDNDESSVVLGAGTLLNESVDRELPTRADRVVLGSGAGYGAPPLPGLGRWRIYWVRGPLSAEVLGLERSFAISDPAMLLANLVPRPAQPSMRFAYMPHLASSRAGTATLTRLCSRLGVELIDPRGPVEEVAASIAATGMLLTEALHGAVVADALRVPWVPIKSTRRLLDFKWHDWCRSLAIDYRPLVLPPLWDPSPESGLWDRTRKRLKLRLVEARLRWAIARGRPSLSDEAVHTSVLERMADRCESFRADMRSGTVIAGRPCDLKERSEQQVARRGAIGRVPLTVGPSALEGQAT